MKEEQINDDNLRKAFEQLEPDSRQQEQIWNQIEEKKNNRKRQKRVRFLSSAALLALVLVAGFTLDVMTGGNVVAKVRQLMGMDQKSEELVKDTMNIGNKGIAVYAPELFFCSEDRVIFGSNRGLLIYDRKEQRTIATIDLQDTDFQYFNSDPTSTKVLVNGDTITLFNVKGTKVTGTFSQYQIQTGEQQTVALNPTDTGTADNSLVSEWNRIYQKKYLDTFQQFQGEEFIQNQGKEDEKMYSEKSLVWNNQEGAKQITCLLATKSGEYSICTKDQKESVQTETLMINENGDGTQVEAGNQEGLPTFTYEGDDPVMDAVCGYLLKEDSQFYVEDGQVYIPSPVLYQSVEKGGELLVFGNFWSETYTLNGKVLECVAGGEMPACMHMKKRGDGYQVTAITVAEDGSDYTKSIEKFTEGYPKILKMFQDDETTNKCHLAMRKEMIRMYVKKNGLDVTSYKDYGWDPVSIK